MIAKARAITHTKESLSYTTQKREAEEILRGNLSGETPEELCEEFRVIQSLNTRCRNNTIQVEISPTIEDGKRLTTEQWQSIASDYLRDMGLSDNRQYVVVLHNDREHKHLHILANRIDLNGRAYSDSNISYRSGVVIERIAKELGLTTAISVREQRQRELEPLKQRIQVAHRVAFHRGITLQRYAERMARSGIEVIYNRAKTTDTITGMSFKVEGIKLKASEVSAQLSYNKLFKDQHTKSTNTSKLPTTSRAIKKLHDTPARPRISLGYQISRLAPIEQSHDNRPLDKDRDKDRELDELNHHQPQL